MTKKYILDCVCAFIKLHHSDQNIKNIWSFGMSNYEMKYMALLVTPLACTLVIQGIPMQIEIYKLKIMTYLSYNYKLIHVISWLLHVDVSPIGGYCNRLAISTNNQLKRTGRPSLQLAGFNGGSKSCPFVPWSGAVTWR